MNQRLIRLWKTWEITRGEYLKYGGTIVISGPTGTGKSYLATALGELACRQGYKVKYYTKVTTFIFLLYNV